MILKRVGAVSLVSQSPGPEACDLTRGVPKLVGMVNLQSCSTLPHPPEHSVDCWQDNQREGIGRQHPADDNRRKWALHLRADPRVQGHRHKSKRGDQCCHENGAKPRERALLDCLFE